MAIWESEVPRGREGREGRKLKIDVLKYMVENRARKKILVRIFRRKELLKFTIVLRKKVLGG